MTSDPRRKGPGGGSTRRASFSQAGLALKGRSQEGSLRIGLESSSHGLWAEAPARASRLPPGRCVYRPCRRLPAGPFRALRREPVGVHHVPPGVDTETFAPATIRGAATLGLSHDAAVALSVRRLTGAGLPALAVTAGGPAEILVKGETGLLYPSGDDEALASLLRRLADDVELHSSLGTQARDDVVMYSPERVAEQIVDVYERVLQRAHSEAEWLRWSSTRSLSRGMRAFEDEREATSTIDEATGRRPSITHGADNPRSGLLCTACPGRVDSPSPIP